MGFLDSAIRSAAKTAIGIVSDTPVTYTRTPATSYEPTDGEESTELAQVFSPKTTPPRPFDTRYINGTTVLQDDLRVSIAASELGFVPDPETDTLTFRGVTYRIVPPVMVISSGDQDALYKIQLRR